MKRTIPFFLIFLSFVVAAMPTAAQNNLPPEVREMARKVMMPVVCKVPGMDKVKVVQNLKYTKTDDPNVLMDIYLPPDAVSDEKRPAVVFIHGGAKTEYTPKDWGIYTSWGRLVAASGFVGVTFTHSLEYPAKSLEEGAHDVRAAIDYVRANADKYKIDKDRICLSAYSAGGPMLSLAMNGEMPFVRCLVGFYAFMDVQQSDYRKTETPETLKTFSPITYLQKDATKIPPLFIGRAGRDEVPMMDDSIDRFVKEALVKNVAFTLANHPQGAHSFDNQNDDERSREIIRGALTFMRDHLIVSTPATASGVDDESKEKRALTDLENSWLKSEGDAAALEKILGFDFVHPVATGNFLTKAEHISYSKKFQPADDLKRRFGSLNVRRYGEVGIVNGIVIASNQQGEDVKRTIFTDVFVYRDARWQAINAQENIVEKLNAQ